MKVYTLSQEVTTALGFSKWVVINESRNYDSAIQYFEKVRTENPESRFSVLSVEEILIADTKEQTDEKNIPNDHRGIF